MAYLEYSVEVAGSQDYLW